MRGRPTDYTPKLAGEICELLADGKSLRSICLSPEMPNKATVFDWLAKYKEFNDQYARAREVQAESIFEEAMEIADTFRIGEKTKTNKDGEVIEIQTGDTVERAKLQVDTRKWFLSKMLPKRFGDKLDLNHGGSVHFEITPTQAAIL